MTAPADARALLVADSFRVRVRDGVAEVRGFSAHLDRFRDTVGRALGAESTSGAAPAAEEASAAEQLDAFLGAARARIAEAGAGFPRLELWREPDGHTSFSLAIRPLPPLRETIELRSAGVIALAHPDRKGPGIARLGALAQELGAEPLLLSPAGTVREGATTSLVYWLDGDEDGNEATGRVIADTERVASVTERLLRAAAAGTARRSITEGRATPAQLLGCEVWAVNALHGIRPVTRLDGAELPAPHAARLRWFREALDRSWEPVR